MVCDFVLGISEIEIEIEVLNVFGVYFEQGKLRLGSTSWSLNKERNCLFAKTEVRAVSCYGYFAGIYRPFALTLMLMRCCFGFCSLLVGYLW